VAIRFSKAAAKIKGFGKKANVFEKKVDKKVDEVDRVDEG